MFKALEITANLVNATSIVLAGMNSIHTWWVGIAGCTLFGVLFYHSQLYADATLQLFFIGTSVLGWRNWRGRNEGVALPVRRTAREPLAFMVLGAAGLAAGYGWLLHRFTNAYAPFVDSMVLAFSILGQLLLMHRRYETWWCWIVVNTVAVPLFLSRGLGFTALLYAAFWVNAVVALVRWRRLLA